MIGRMGEVVLMDWGVAKMMRRGEIPAPGQPGQVIGTPAYMSPENSTFQRSDGAFDLGRGWGLSWG